MNGAERSQTRGRRELTIVDGPDHVTGADGTIIGVEVHVELRVNGELFPIDGHRVFINPPTQVVDAHAVRNGKERVLPKRLRSDPATALWHVLWESVDQRPGRPS
jgi:hypothetical protein